MQCTRQPCQQLNSEGVKSAALCYLSVISRRCSVISTKCIFKVKDKDFGTGHGLLFAANMIHAIMLFQVSIYWNTFVWRTFYCAVFQVSTMQRSLAPFQAKRRNTR